MIREKENRFHTVELRKIETFVFNETRNRRNSRNDNRWRCFITRNKEQEEEKKLWQKENMRDRLVSIKSPRRRFVSLRLCLLFPLPLIITDISSLLIIVIDVVAIVLTVNVFVIVNENPKSIHSSQWFRWWWVPFRMLHRQVFTVGFHRPSCALRQLNRENTKNTQLNVERSSAPIELSSGMRIENNGRSRFG